jgi:integral membrane sensor domain MASE1
MSLNNNKWQRMSDVVSQHHAILQPNLSWQFRKLVISRLLTENILTFLFQYVGLMLVDALTPQTIAPVWFSSGTACAFIFMRGYYVLPGILLGSFYAYYVSTGSIFQSGISSGIDAAQAFLLLWFSYRYISPTLVFYNIKKFVKFILCCGILTAIASVIIGSFYYSTLQLWLRLWLGNLSGILVFSLTILTWDLYFLQIDHLKKLNKLILTFYYGLLFINMIALLFSHTPFLTMLFTLSTLPMILLISLHLGWCGVIAAIFLFGLSLNFAVYLNAPLFSTHFSLMTLTYIQSILVMETIVGLSLAIRFYPNCRSNSL